MNATTEQIDEWARLGAQRRVQDIAAEIETITVFLNGDAPVPQAVYETKRTSGNKPWSAAMRAAQSRRMKTFWATKRKAER